MLNWNEMDWRVEQKAKEFANEILGKTELARPHFLRTLGWDGIQALERELMAAWLRVNVQMQGFEAPK